MQAVLQVLFCTGRGVHQLSTVTRRVQGELQRKGPLYIDNSEPQDTERTKGTMAQRNASILHRHIGAL